MPSVVLAQAASSVRLSAAERTGKVMDSDRSRGTLEAAVGFGYHDIIVTVWGEE